MALCRWMCCCWCGSRSSDIKQLDREFTVIEGTLKRRLLRQMLTVSGGKLDYKGQSKGWKISKATLRAMIDSALGLDPNHERAAARQKRVIHGLTQLDGIVFAARVMAELSSDPQYKVINKLGQGRGARRGGLRGLMRGENVAARTPQC